MTNIDTVQNTGRPAADGSPGEHDPVPAAVDWLLGILTGVVGLVLAAVGVNIYTKIDQAAIADAVADDNVQLNGLTESEFVTAVGPFIDWLAAGIVVTGIVCVVAAVAFVVGRRRTRRRVAQEGGTTATFWACAVYGAVMTTLVSFIPGAAVVGGATAAYLNKVHSSVRTGAASGLVTTILAIPLVVFVAVGFIAGAGAIDRFADGTLLATLVLVAELIALAINIGFGALGGFLAARLL